MGKIVDISKYICADAPQMVLFGKTYTVKNDKTTVLLLNQLQREIHASDEDNADYKILKLLLGETAADEITAVLEGSPNYVDNERVIMFNVLALATGEDVESIEARFQQATR